MEHRAGSATSLDRFESRTALPMLLLSIVFVPLFLVPMVFELTPSTESLLTTLGWIIWGAFALDYAIRLSLAPEKRAFVLGNKLDLVVIVLPFLRPLRVVRSARSLRFLQESKALGSFGKVMKTMRAVLTRHKLQYALAVTAALSVFAALLVETFEKDAEGANITSFGDALWWAASTVTTVGYGDKYPVTTGGRWVGTGLMVMGVALFGFLAASLAAVFLGNDSRTEGPDQNAGIIERLDKIEKLLAKNEVESDK